MCTYLKYYCWKYEHRYADMSSQVYAGKVGIIKVQLQTTFSPFKGYIFNIDWMFCSYSIKTDQTIDVD